MTEFQTVEEVLGKHYLDLYKGKVKGYEKENWLPHILQAGVSNIVLLKLYNISVKFKDITAIEQLPKNEKQMLVSECRFTGIVFGNKELIQAAKILHLLKSMG